MTIRGNISWSTHIDNICASAIKHKLKHPPPKIELLAYNTIIRSLLEYALVVWDPHTQNIGKLEQIQRQPVRFIYNRYHRHDSPTTLMQSNGIPMLESRRRSNRLKFLADIWNRKLPYPIFTPCPSFLPAYEAIPLVKCTPMFTRTNAYK